MERVESLSTKKRILVIHPDLSAKAGGGVAVTASIIEALKTGHEVSALTWLPVDVEAIDRMFGTRLVESDFKVLLPPLFLRTIVKLNPYLSPFKFAFLLRICKKIRNEYDVIVSVNNEADFCRKGIQYIHDPPYWIYSVHGKPRPNVGLLLPHHLWAVFKGRYRPWMIVAGFSYDRMKANLTLANSDWTKEKLRESYGIESKTIYPPVLGSFPKVPWEEKENGFICIGRVSPWKQLLRVISIVSAVRERIPNVHLHIIGATSEEAYGKRLLRHAKAHPWIMMSEKMTRNELTKMISEHRYGIHGMINEPFGLAVAEMVCGGCIVFVPRDGGPSEIVGRDERLVYETVDEAASKIVQVMMKAKLQTALRSQLRLGCKRFSQQRFAYEIRDIVARFSPTPEPVAEITSH
jgi:glycosyltransferase involved in cell wall biosynthesis